MDPGNYLPPYPRRLQVASIGSLVGVAMAAYGYGGSIWGSGQPPAQWIAFVGSLFIIVFGVYDWRFRRPPFGPYAPEPRRHKVLVLGSGFGLVAVAIVISAVL